jgi:hypothetical protein
VVGQKFRQASLRRKEQDAQIAAVHDMATQDLGLFDQPAEIRVEFRRAARDIHGGNVGVRQSSDAEFRRLAPHLFFSIRPRINMAMLAGLIAELADVDLKHRDAGGSKRHETDLPHSIFKRWTCGCLCQQLKLPVGGSERVPAGKQCQSHSQDAEKGPQLRSRSFAHLDVLTLYASAYKLPAALLDALFEHPGKNCFTNVDSLPNTFHTT